MKKALAIMLTLVLCLSLAACGGSSSTASTATSTAASGSTSAAPAGETKAAGVCWYNFADTFISNAKTNLENVAAADGQISVTSADSQGDIATQTANMGNLLTQGVDYLVLNNINTGAISDLCQMSDDENVTVIFANTDSPSDEDFAAHENVYFVSSAAEQSGTIMGEAAVKYWNDHPEADRNGNGKMDYVMLLGMQGNYDTEMRSGYAVKAVEDAGIEMNLIGGEIICEWSRVTAQEKIAALLANYSDDIDFVFSCNDDMALGAIEALKASGFFGDGEYLPVCGVDATEAGCAALEEGTLLVTSLNNPISLAKGIYKVMKLTANGEEVTTESIGIPGATVEGHRVWLAYTAITADNVADAKYDVNDTAL